MTDERIDVRCCVVGGGPAGMMLGMLLARAGVEVVVLEKHADFFRDFRGDTVHPSTLQVMHELGWLEEFLQRPHQEARSLTGFVGETAVKIADFSHLPTHCRFIAIMPQWDFLNFLSEHARRFRSFRLEMQAEVTDVIEENGRVVGVRAKTPRGPLEVRAQLTVGADGRSSTVREKGGLIVDDLGAPIDVLWFRIRWEQGDPDDTIGRFGSGRVLAMINRREYWQCGFVIPKGGFDVLRERGLAEFQADVAQIAPFLRDRVHELNDWNQINLLTVKVDRLRSWHRAGLLCIGDAAHAMSPIGGVGINLAIQDAVATANLLAGPLRTGTIGPADLERVQRRREFPTRVTQRLQVLIQKRILGRVLASRRPLKLPFALRLFRWLPFLRRLPARIVGMGIRPEHVETPEAPEAAGRAM